MDKMTYFVSVPRSRGQLMLEARRALKRVTSLSLQLEDGFAIASELRRLASELEALSAIVG